MDIHIKFCPSGHQGKWSEPKCHLAASLNWVTSVEHKGEYSFNGSPFAYNSEPTVPTQLRINTGLHVEASDWAIREILIYDRKLSSIELDKIGDYLSSKYPDLQLGIF